MGLLLRLGVTHICDLQAFVNATYRGEGVRRHGLEAGRQEYGVDGLRWPQQGC